ncbi:hypothetical protein PR202_gb05031 [Eleusine coracana subsp. coracana]|uniref:Anoctamin transmembrane domain-containing protein n=1 Tax=Eleusine coracana subsp. coracana TaxID=191504 RepID=A0AAV5E3J8_ELECO|nr:hypothetical protein PR202_gb05031 [Eleusine coracana subsp. coracana]
MAAGMGERGGGGGAGGGERTVEETTEFEVGIVVPKLSRAASGGHGGRPEDCVARLVRELEGAGLLVDRVRGVPAEFIKLAAPMGTLGRAAAEMRMKKLTYIGMELQFEWDQVAAFVRQPDGSLFSWRERYCCFRYLIYGIANKTESQITLKFDEKEFQWNPSEPLLTRLEAEGVVKLVFPLHDEFRRKQLLRNWALNWLDFTWQPIDEIYSYFGTKLPFELAYAHLYEITETEVMRYLLTAVYLVAIQYYTRIGGKVSVNLIKYENNQGEESSSASLVYKSYIGLFYHASLHRDILALRQVLIQRLIVAQLLENLIENSIPYLKYSYKKYIAVHKKKHEKESPSGKSVRLSTRVEKEYLKPSYTASIGAELEDGLFDDYLELTLQFGMIMMFACAFPLIFCFAALNNVTEIRADALKLLVMLKRPIPRAAATIGAWLNILQFLVVMAICTNCLLLVCLYDKEGSWRIEPGLAAILIVEHLLLLVKFGFSHFVPEEPAWVKANRVRYVAQAQTVCSKQLLRSISKLDAKLD